MKTIFLSSILLFVVVGCSKPDPRIAELEQKLTTLESNHWRLQASFDRVYTNQHSINENIAFELELLTTLSEGHTAFMLQQKTNQLRRTSPPVNR